MFESAFEPLQKKLRLACRAPNEGAELIQEFSVRDDSDGTNLRRNRQHSPETLRVAPNLANPTTLFVSLTVRLNQWNLPVIAIP